MLVVGLGNPGSKYSNTRHNIGFMVLDILADFYKLPNFTSSLKFNAEICELSLNNQKIILCKPMTYMNESGLAVSKIANFYKITPENLIVIHDDLDLDLYKLRYKIGGSSGGHNGLKSIDKLYSQQYARLRIGIGRPTIKSQVSSYVLSNFSQTETSDLKILMQKIAENFEFLIDKKIAQFIEKTVL